MDNINKIHIGDNSVNKLLFASPITGKHGDALWSYYKFANDAGGYYVHGLWLAIINGAMGNAPYAWPWDLGVPGGALKDVNDGAHRWGYVQDGYNKNITKGMNINFPLNGWSENKIRIGLHFYRNNPKPTDLGDNAITITFLDGRFDDCPFTYDSDNIVVSENKRTITINKFNRYQVQFIIDIPAEKYSIKYIRQLLTNVYVNVSGLSIHYKESDKPVDPSTVRCWTVYHGSDVLYHENKTKENAWEAYNLITTETIPGTESKLIVKSFVGLDGTKKVPTLDIYKDADFYSKAADGTVTFQRFNGILNNKEVATKVKEWFAAHTISQIFTNNPNRNEGLFYASDIDGTLTLNMNGTNMSGVAEFADSNIEKVIINTGTVTSLHELFYRAGNLREVELENAARSQDISGAFEFCHNLLKLPKINWGDGNWSFGTGEGATQYKGPCSNAGFAFEYCYRLPEIPQYGSTRDAATNTLTFVDYSPQTFNQCKALTRIGPILDFRYLKPANAYLIFGGCTALTDLRLKNLNHGSWDFTEKAINGVVHGNLSALDAESVKYLIDNLSDLTVTSSDDEHAISEVRTAELHCPSTWTSITDAQVTAANAKGWRIFVDGVERVVTN